MIADARAHPGLEVGQTYTRVRVQELIGVEQPSTGGSWGAGYARHDTEFYIFARIPSAGRTGHDYDNRWVGEALHWSAPTRTTTDHSDIKAMLLPDARCHVFTRDENRSPFVYRGMGRPVVAHRGPPVRLVWSFAARPAMAAGLPTTRASARIRAALESQGGKADVAKRGGSFHATLVDGGVEVDNLAKTPFLPWSVFDATYQVLVRQSGRARRGDAMGYRLGDPELSADTVEGCVAASVYGTREGDTVFRRVTPICGLLVWAGVCRDEPGELVLVDERNGAAAPSGLGVRPVAAKPIAITAPAAPVAVEPGLSAEARVQQVIDHVRLHGAITEPEATTMLGGPREMRKFARQVEAHASAGAVRVRIEFIGGVKRYVKESPA